MLLTLVMVSSASIKTLSSCIVVITQLASVMSPPLAIPIAAAIVNAPLLLSIIGIIILSAPMTDMLFRFAPIIIIRPLTPMTFTKD